MVIHYGKDDRVIMIEVLNASKVVLKLVETLAKREVVIA